VSKKNIPVILHAAVLALLLGLAACTTTTTTTPSSSGDPYTTATGSATAPVEKPEIPLDKAVPGISQSVARNFYVVFDGSGSMDERCGEGDQQFSNKLQGAKWAVREFLKKVPDDANLGLYVFDDNGSREDVPLGSGNRQRVLDEIGKIAAGGRTPLGQAIGFGSERLVQQYQKQLGYGEYRLVVVTDGEATDDLYEGVRRARQYRFAIPIDTIGFCMGSDHALRRYSDSYRMASNSNDLARALEETLAEMDSFETFGK